MILEPESIPLLKGILLWNVSFRTITIESIIAIAVLILLLFASALISGSEVAFFSLSPSDKETLKNSKKKSNQVIESLLMYPEKLLATILVANNFINVSVVIISAYVSRQLVDFSQTPVLGFVSEVVVITFILLLFGEILPKIYASSFALGFAHFMARPLKLCAKLFTPLSTILIRSTSIVNKRMSQTNKNLSINEISQALELTSEEEFSEDKGILEGIVKFGSTDVDQIMTPRIDVVALEIDSSYTKVLEIIKQTSYSRIPVYKDSFDEIEGILYVKDLLIYLHEQPDFKWQNLIRETYFVPENKKIDDLLKEFQKEKVHLAIVVDEYGGTSGIVTLEDILEEIVGDIIDEFDDDDRLFSIMDENTYLFDGKTQLNDFYRICNLDDDFFHSIKGEADTIAGLLLEMKSDFPALNEKLSFGHIDFIVEAMDKRRIKKIKVVFNNNPV